MNFSSLAAWTGLLALVTGASAPPPPPPLAGTDSSAESTTIQNAAGDRVVLESDKLVEYTLLFHGTVGTAASAYAVELADGRQLRIDGETPAGEYLLKDGRRVRLDERFGYP